MYDILIYPEFYKTMALKGVENNRFAPKTCVLALLDCVLYSSCKVRPIDTFLIKLTQRMTVHIFPHKDKTLW